MIESAFVVSCKRIQIRDKRCGLCPKMDILRKEGAFIE